MFAEREQFTYESLDLKWTINWKDGGKIALYCTYESGIDYKVETEESKKYVKKLTMRLFEC